MCHAVALPVSDVPTSLLDGGALDDRVHNRGGESEVRFSWWNKPPVLPVMLDGRLQLVTWGNRNRAVRSLPTTGWTWRATIEAGQWSALKPKWVVIPATYAFTGGVWFRLKKGMLGLLVRTPNGDPVVYVICDEATRYYRVMTRSEFMPVLIDEVI
jgi:hypothetical protein